METDDDNISRYDITLFGDGGRTDIKDLNGTATVIIPVNKNVKEVRHYKSDGTYTLLEFVKGNGKVSFETDAFSIFELVYEPDQVTTGVTSSGVAAKQAQDSSRSSSVDSSVEGVQELVGEGASSQSDSSDGSVTDHVSKSDELPQTGTHALAMASMGVSAILSGLGLSGIRSKRK